MKTSVIRLSTSVVALLAIPTYFDLWPVLGWLALAILSVLGIILVGIVIGTVLYFLWEFLNLLTRDIWRISHWLIRKHGYTCCSLHRAFGNDV